MFRVINNIIWLLSDKVIRLGVGLFLTTAIAKNIGPSDFGSMAYAVSFVSLSTGIVTLGFDNILVRQLVKSPNLTGEYLITSLLLRFFSSTIVLLAIFLITSSVINSQIKEADFIIIITLGSVLFNTSSVLDCFFQSITKSKYTVISQQISFIVFSLIKLFFLIKKFSVTFFVYTIALEYVLSSCMLTFFFIHNKPVRAQYSFDLQIAKQLLRDGFPILVSTFAIAIYGKVDQLIIFNILGSNSVGFYSAAQRISDILYILPMALSISLFPAIIKDLSIKNKFSRVSRYLFIALFTCLLFAIPVSIFSNQIINILYGKAFYQSGIILKTFALLSILNGMGIFISSILFSLNLQKYATFFALKGALISIILNLALIPKFGIDGALISAVFSQSIAFISFIFYRRTSFILPLFLKSIDINYFLKLIFRFYKYNVAKTKL